MQPLSEDFATPTAERQRRLMLALAALTARRLFGICDPHLVPITGEQIAGFLELCAPALTSFEWLAIHPAVLNYAYLFPGDLRELRVRMDLIRPYAYPDLAGVDSEDARHIRQLVKALRLLPPEAQSAPEDAR
jgi:hypothetical protein